MNDQLKMIPEHPCRPSKKSRSEEGLIECSLKSLCGCDVLQGELEQPVLRESEFFLKLGPAVVKEWYIFASLVSQQRKRMPKMMYRIRSFSYHFRAALGGVTEILVSC